MNSFDKVIGYEAVKKELLQVCDMIKNREVYENFGAKMPRGIMLIGDPGLGKTLMAKCFIEESGLKAFTVRKNTSENFAGHITEVFEKAKDEAPCIVFLDDMDKYANEDSSRCDAEEYVSVQAGIDGIAEKDVFVLATVNEKRKLPESLRRAGRFDKKIVFGEPSGEDVRKIIEHFFKNKKVSPDVNIDDVSKMIHYRSCAELETIINEAAIHAAGKRKNRIENADVINAVLRFEYKTPEDFLNADKEMMQKLAYHEAGHVVMSELLKPGSVGLVSFRAYGNEYSGFTRSCKALKSDSHQVLVALAGKAVVELFFGTCDTGCDSDLRKACDYIRNELVNAGVNGMGMIDITTSYFTELSENMISRNEAVVHAELERYMFKAKEMLVNNKEFVVRVANELMAKKTLLYSDVQRIRENVSRLKSAV